MIFKSDGSFNGRFISFALLCIIALFLVFASYFTVKEQERGIVTMWGQFGYVANPGIGFKIPLAQAVYAMPVDAQALRISDHTADNKEEGVNTYTIDNQEVDIIATVQYRIDPKDVERVYKNFLNYKARLYEIVLDRLKAEMGKVNITHVAEQRGKIRDAVEEIVKRDAALIGVTVTDFQLSDIQYTKSFRLAVSQAADAKAKIDQKEHERVQEEKTAQTRQIKALGEANAAREAAKGEADAIEVKAKAEARAIQIKGEAQAAAMRAQANALQANAHLVQMKIAEQWNGALPQWMTPGSPVPLLNLQAPK
jgi:regulator of protease activity HflC (stomatin/prohibitin superfamily)